jgi:MFS family permease
MTDLVRFSGPRHARVPVHSVLRRIYLPRAADATASSMATYAVPLLVLATTDSASLTGIAFALEWIPRLCAFGLAGAAVDRLGATRVFRVAATARTAVTVTAALALASMDGGASRVTVMLLAALTGILAEFSYVAAETIGAVASREAGDGAHRAQSVLMGIDQSSALAGPALGGVLLQWAGPGGMLTTIGCLSFLSAVLAPRVRRTEPSATMPVTEGLRAGWSTLRSIPTLAWLVAGLTLSNLTSGTLQAAAPVIMVKELGHSSASVGLLWSAAAAASLIAVAVCRYAIGKWGLWPVGCVSAAAAALACLAVTQAHSYPSYLLLISTLMAGEAGMSIVLRTLRSRLIPPAAFGSTLSLTILIVLLPFPLAGALVAFTPPHALGHVITVCAILQAVGLAIAFSRIRTDPVFRAPNSPCRAHDPLKPIDT